MDDPLASQPPTTEQNAVRTGLRWRVNANKRSNVRFSIRSLLLATFWLCLWGGDLVIYRELIDAPRISLPFVLVPMWLFLIAGPFVVVGTVVNHTRRGLVVGTTFGMLILLWSILFVRVR